MLKSYFKLAIRNLFRNKVASFINLIGLSIAVGVCLVVFTFVDLTLFADDFHENADEIYMVENVIDRGHNDLQLWGDTPLPIGKALREDFPQVKRAVRIRNGSGEARYEDKVFNERIRYVDGGFLDMFTFPLKWGDKLGAEDLDGVILSERVSIKYFGEENPVGKQLQFTFRDTIKKTFTIRGVAEKFPQRASFGFNMLMNWEVQRMVGYDDLEDWKRFISATFIQLDDPSVIEILKTGEKKYLEAQNAVQKDWAITEFRYEKILDLRMRGGNEVRGSITSGPPPAAIYTLTIIGVFLILLACFNYINIAIASASQRLKEIGIRKVVGSSRGQIIWQFLGENMLLCIVALIAGVVLAEFVFLPAFINWVDINSQVELNLQEDLHIWIFLAGLLVLTGLGAGAYPAFVVSAFQPVNIFSGKLKIGGKAIFTKIFLTLQFFFSIFLVVAGIVFTQNSLYQRDKDWGYDQEGTITIPVNKVSEYHIMHDAVKQHPNVMQVAASRQHFGRWDNTAVVEYKGERYEFKRFEVGLNYMEAMGVRLKEGRLFDPNLETDKTQAVIINQEMVRAMEWENPLQEQFTYDSVLYSVVGIVEDFHYHNFFSKIRPSFFRLLEDEEKYAHIVVRVVPGKMVEMSDFLKAHWKENIPDEPYRGFFQDGVFDEFYKESQGISNIFISVATMALLLTCMGLFGLVSLIVAKRMKEFSIRKVLGASVGQLGKLLTNQFLWVLLIALILAVPLSYVFLDKFILDDIFDFRVPITPLPFVIGGIVVLLASLLTISSQLRKVAQANPVDALRDE